MSQNTDGSPAAFRMGMRDGMKWCFGFNHTTSNCSNPEPHRAHNPYPRGTAQHDDWERGAMIASNVARQFTIWDDGQRPAQWVEPASNDIGF